MHSGGGTQLPRVSVNEGCSSGLTMSHTHNTYPSAPPMEDNNSFSNPSYPQQHFPQQAYPQGPHPQYGFPSPQGDGMQGEPPPSYSQATDPEQGYPKPETAAEEMGDFANFTEKSIRHGFIKKVFGLLCVQLIITGGVVSIFLFVKEVKEYTANNSWVYISTSCLVIVMIIAMGCSESLRRKSPTNYIFLFIFTVVMSAMLGAFAGAFSTDEILIALGAVVGVTILMTILGIQTKIDFTPLHGVACMLTMVIIYYGIMCAIFRSRYSSLAYACLGAAAFSIWLLVDIQLLMGGKRKVSIDPEEYVFAALQIYIDIIYIFIFILSIVGFANR